MQSAADKYNSYGLSVVPINDKKQAFNWKQDQSQIVRHDYSRAYGMALVCGKVSGNVEVIDFDTKYDLTGTLMTRYRELVNSYDPNILKKLLWQKSPSGGYHAIYKCETIGGSRKLAQREATPEEKAKGDKINVLIETKGEGGYVGIDPTPKYKLISGTFESIPTITIAERETLLNCASNFNEYFKPEINYTVSKMTKEGKSPLDDYDQRGDCVSLLIKHGWRTVKEQGAKILLKRPGSTDATHSGNFDRDRNWFSVFTTSSEFEAQKPYKPSAVYAMLECKGDYHEAAKRLVNDGYGEKTDFEKPQKKKPKVESKIERGDKTFSYVASDKEMDVDLDAWRNGTFQKGLSWGIPELDIHHVLKRGTFNPVNGHDNVGKSVVLWYLLTLSAMRHGWKWIIFSAENKASTAKKRIIEFYWGEEITKMNAAKYAAGKEWFKKHFKILKCEEVYNYLEVITMTENIMDEWPVDGLLIDPYNALSRETNGGRISTHDYDYDAATYMKTWGKRKDVAIYLNCHAISAANRLKDSDGQPAAPMKADTEGGSKWAAKADDFLTVHRYVYDENKYRFTMIYVRKVKETETGGRCTSLKEPVIIEMIDQCRFESASGADAVRNWHKKPTQTMIEAPTTPTVKPNTHFTDSRSVKEANEPVVHPSEDDPLNPKSNL